MDAVSRYPLFGRISEEMQKPAVIYIHVIWAPVMCAIRMPKQLIQLPTKASSEPGPKPSEEGQQCKTTCRMAITIIKHEHELMGWERGIPVGNRGHVCGWQLELHRRVIWRILHCTGIATLRSISKCRPGPGRGWVSLCGLRGDNSDSQTSICINVCNCHRLRWNR